MDLSWTPKQSALRDSITQFATQSLNEGLLERDRSHEFNRMGWRQCGEMGIQGLPIPIAYGGAGADPLTAMFAFEGLGAGCKDNGLNFAIGAHTWGCSMPILALGNEEQKQQYLPALCAGKSIGSLAISERGAGSDAYGLQTTAEKQGDNYLLNGSKMFVTNSPIADLILVVAITNPSKGTFGLSGFLVEKGTPGLTVGPPIEKMGLHTVPMGELFFDNCYVPVANRLGREGTGMALFTHAMEWERGFILASAVGAMQRQLDDCVRYVRQRQQFGQAIGKFQLVASKIVEMRMRLETAKALLYKVGWLKQQGESVILEAAMAKLHISEAWVQSCQDALQIHGGYGYLTEHEVERDLRDALGSKLYSGTSEIQHQVIAQMMKVS